jgi:hypothetical protein
VSCRSAPVTASACSWWSGAADDVQIS